MRSRSRVIDRRGDELEDELFEAVRSGALAFYEPLMRAPRITPGRVHTPEVSSPAPMQYDEIVEDQPTPILSFIAGGLDCGAVSSTAEVDTPAVAPLPAGVVGRLFKWERRPALSSLFKVKVVAATEDQVNLSCDAGSVDLDLGGTPGSLGGRTTQKWILPWYGEAGDLGGAQWDDIELFEVSAGGSIPFATSIDARCGAGEGSLGLIDVIFEDPDTGKGRSCRYGVFKTREPKATFVLPQLDHDRVRVVLDDGYDDTNDELDITALVAIAGAETTVDLPAWTDLEDGPCEGRVNHRYGRSRMLVEEAEDHDIDGDCAVLMLGENRLRIYEGEQLVFCAHSFHYTDDAPLVPAGHNPNDVIETEDGPVEIIAGSLSIDFVDDTDDATISDFLHAARLRPCSFASQDKILEGRTHGATPTAELTALVELYREQEDSIEDLALTPLGTPDPQDQHLGVLESVPRNMHRDFSSAQDTFLNARRHYHHFVIHTFAAHRLIEQILLPRARPPVVSLSGVQFPTNKSFVSPGAFPSIRRIGELYKEDPARKLAIFGHTDRVGASDYNEGLSLSRARSVEALLRNRIGFWFDRFGRHTEVVGSSADDQRWVLDRLGHADMSAFQAAQGIPVGPVNQQTRDELAKALREDIGAQAEPLEFEDGWGTREYQHMLMHLGLYAGPADGSHRASYVQAVRDFQAGNQLHADGDIGIVTRVALIDAYQRGLVIDEFAADRFHTDAVFGCGEAFPRVPTADGVESQQNRRVEIVLRREPIEPVDPATQRGPTVPYPDWLQPEMPEGSEGGELPNVVVAVADTGLGNNNDFSGEALEQRNDLQLIGKRLIRPTDVSGAAPGNPAAHTVAVDGDLRNLIDLDPVGHGTSVMTCLGGDGSGTAGNNTAATVLGTGPHVKIRPVRLGAAFNFWNLALVLEVVASDPDVLVYSTSCHLYRIDTAVTDRQRRRLESRLQDMIGQGKLAFATAGNYRAAFAGRYDTATREFGSQAPDRRESRKHPSLTGAHAHRAFVSIVGSSCSVARIGTIQQPGQRDTVADHTYLGEQVMVHMPGENIQCVLPDPANPGALLIQQISGTSFATPMTAGVAGELLLLDEEAREPANLPRILEYIDATADPLPDVDPAGGQGAPANPRNADPGADAGGPPNGPESPTANSTYQNIRRVHFWKAALAAANKGLSAEGRGNDGAPDGFFEYCTLRGDASTQWYGFEVRSPTPNAALFWRKTDGTVVALEDFAAHVPGGTMANTWRIVDLPELAPGQPLPAYPFRRDRFTAAGRTPYFMCQLSIKKDELAQFQALLVYLPEIDPLDPDGAAGPAVVEIDVSDRAALRDPASLAGDPDLGKQAIATFVRFDNFVFYVTAVPQPVASFQLVAQDRRTDAGLGEELEVLLFAVDRFGFLAQPGAGPVPNVTHDGTAGAAGAPNTGVFLDGNPAPAGGVTPIFGAGGDHPGVARIRFQGFTLETVTLRFDDGAGHAGSIAIEVRPAGPLAAFRCEPRRRAGGVSVVDDPLAVGEAFELEVTAVDGGGVTVTSFNGEVELRVAKGQPGSAGAPPQGVHVKNADGDPFNPSAFRKRLNNGVGVFPLFCYTTGDLQLEVEDDQDHTGASRTIEIVAGALAQLRVQATTPQTTGNRFAVTVTALDASGNVLSDYTGTVTLSLAAGTAGATAADGTKSGVQFGDTQAAADDSYTFDHADEGSHEFTVAAYTAETIRIRASDGAISGDSEDIVVNATAIDHFAFAAAGADRAETRFTVEVSARDANHRIVSDFTGNVTLRAIQGGAFVAGPPSAGVRIETAAGVIGNQHAYVAADHGRFVFHVTGFTAGDVQLEATDGAVTSQSPVYPLESGAIESFQVTPSTLAAARNVPIQITVAALDGAGNVVPGFVGAVTLTRTRNGGAEGAFAPEQTHTFTSADAGSFVYTVRFNRRGQYVVVASDTEFRGASATITIN